MFVLVPALVLAGLYYLYSNHKARIYAASTTLYVQQPASTNQNVGSVDIPGSSLLAPTYSDMITDPVITTQVDQLMSKSYPGYRIEGHSLTTDQKPGSSTLLVRLSVQDTVPQRAVVAADMVAAVFIKRLKQLDSARYVHDDELLRHQLAAARTVAAKVALQLRNYVGPSAGYQALQSTLNGDQSTVQQVEGSYTQFQVTRDNVLTGVSVYSPAIVPGTPISPHPGRDALLSFVVVCMLGIVAIRLYDYVDDSLRNPEEVEAITGAPILGTIPRFSQHRESSALVTVSQPASSTADAYRLVRTNLLFSAIDDPVRTVLITSTHMGEGKSTTASNLAQVFSEGEHQVTLIDGDLRRPTIHRIFGITRNDGLTSLLMRTPVSGQPVLDNQQANLHVIASGPLPPNPTDLLGSKRMESLLKELQASNDLTIIDCSPILAVPDSVVLASIADGVVLVVDLDRTKRRDLRRATEAIKGVGGKVIGIVINRLVARGAGYYYHSYGYGDAYGSDTSGGRPKGQTANEETARSGAASHSL